MAHLLKHITKSVVLSGVALVAMRACANADDLLDGRFFTGLIGPAENPDLHNRLMFNDGHFWSDICTRCGFLPGPDAAEETSDVIQVTGVLQIAGSGTFA